MTSIKTIKVTPNAHRKLKSMAALKGIYVHELIEQMIQGQVQRRNKKEWSLCATCKTGVTSADAEMGCCTNCGAPLRVIQ